MSSSPSSPPSSLSSALLSLPAETTLFPIFWELNRTVLCLLGGLTARSRSAYAAALFVVLRLYRVSFGTKPYFCVVNSGLFSLTALFRREDEVLVHFLMSI